MLTQNCLRWTIRIALYHTLSNGYAELLVNIFNRNNEELRWAEDQYEGHNPLLILFWRRTEPPEPHGYESSWNVYWTKKTLNLLLSGEKDQKLTEKNTSTTKSHVKRSIEVL